MELEKENFKINSKGWKTVDGVKENKENRGFCYSCEDTIKVKKISTKYEISNGDNSIQVKVREDGNLTIRTCSGNSQFKFENSNPEMVRKIAELIIKATELK